MNDRAAIRKFFYSSWFMALIPAIIIFFFLPPLHLKHKLSIEGKTNMYNTGFYYDLDSDSVTELIQSGKGIPYYYILVQDNDYHVYDQWNFRDNLDPEVSDFFFGNFDRDRYKEIYIFTYADDSLFLNVNEFKQSDGIRINHEYITQIGVINKTVNSIVFPAGFYDLDKDNYDEFYFSIWTGFSLAPRSVYCYNLKTKELIATGPSGAIPQIPVFEDADGDAKPEFFGAISASGNYKTVVPFSDRSAWLMVFDENLKFEFPPVEFPGFTNFMITNLLVTDKFTGYVLNLHNASADSTVRKPRIMTYSLLGKPVKEKLYSDLGLGSDRVEMIILDKKRIFLQGKEIVELNCDLEVIKRKKSPFKSRYSTFVEDINSDGQEEILLYCGNEERIVVLNTNLEKLAEAEMKAEEFKLKFSHFSSENGEKRLFVSYPSGSQFISMTRNRFYFLGYLEYPAVYFVFFLFIIVIKRINTLQIVHRESLKQRLITLQLQGIKSQLDPHFTFNTLNSVASLIYLKERESAYDYLNKFTRLLRSMLNDAERIYRRLGEEIEFVTTYLELEKLRFGNKFDFKIEVGEGITLKEEVPKLVLQTFAENAVKHGIMPCSEGGLLTIKIEKKNEYLCLVIQDNGVGRVKAAGHSESTGKGLKLTTEFYDILNEINKKPIRHEIKDLYDESGLPAGTLVEVWVPLNPTERIMEKKFRS